MPPTSEQSKEPVAWSDQQSVDVHGRCVGTKDGLDVVGSGEGTAEGIAPVGFDDGCRDGWGVGRGVGARTGALVGAVGADAMSPTWLSWDTQRSPAECSPTLATSCAAWGECSFWRLVRLAEPSGIVRLLYQAGVGGFDTSVRAFPQDVRSDSSTAEQRSQ